jgi:hypothetical protein
MAPKPKKMTDADKAKLKKLAAGKGARSDGGLTSDQKLELLGLRDMERKSRSYSPAPMSAAAKKKAAAAGKATGAKTSARKPKAGSGVASKVASRVKTTAREARDIKTALSNTYRAGVAQAQYPGFNDNKQQLKKTVKALKKQVKEVGTAAITGKKGTTAGSTRTTSYDKRPPQKFSKNIIPSGVEYKKGTKRK